MGELQRLVGSGKTNPRAPFLAVLVLLLAGGCAAPAPLKPTLEPRVSWVLEDIHSLGGEVVRVLGSPTVQRTGAFPALSFDGRDDALILSSAPLENLNRFTIEVLLRPDADGEAEQRFFHVEDKAGQRVLLELRLDPPTGRWSLDTYLHASAQEHCTLLDRSRTHAAGQWYWVALVYDGQTMSHYVNGVRELSGPVKFPPMTSGRTSIGVRLNRINWFKGAIREVRVFDRPLATEQLSR